MPNCEHGLFGCKGFGIMSRCCCSRCSGQRVALSSSVALGHVLTHSAAIAATKSSYISALSEQGSTPHQTTCLPHPESVSADDVLTKIRCEIDGWELTPEQHERTLEVSAHLMEIVQQGGAGLIVQSNACKASLNHEPTDDGYLLRHLAKDKEFTHLNSDTKRDFASIYTPFTKHRDNDLWGSDAPTADGHEKRKDGGFAFKGDGRLVWAAETFAPKASARKSDFSWPDSGSRHKAALGIANALRHGIVYVKGSTDKIHVLTASDARNGAIFHLETEVQRPSSLF